MRRLWLIAPLCVVGFLGSDFLLGQDKKTDKEPIIVTARLPPYYNKLGLTPKQKAEIYRIHGKYTVEIRRLNEQIAAMRTKEKADMESVLSAAQKARLREIRVGAGDKEKEIEEKPIELQKPTGKKK